MLTSDRRQFLAALSALPMTAATATPGRAVAAAGSARPGRAARIKTSCNLYSFNAPLRSGEMSLAQVIEFCAELGFDAVDPTGYYFAGYPDAPDDALLYRTKRLAFSLGLDISGTGVRNDFALPDAAARAAEVALVGRWVEVSARLGAPVLRVFAGLKQPPGHSMSDVNDWIVEHLSACAELGRQRGVIIVLQNHHDVHKSAAETLEMRRRVSSEWFGLNVDIGSLRLTADPYAEIAALAPHAMTWQVKEQIYRNEREERVDLRQIARILRDVGYRGYVPIETLGPGDPREKVRRFLDEFREAIA